MTTNEAFEGLKKVLLNIRQDADLSNVTMDSKLAEDLAIDSLSMFLLGLAIEKEFGITVDSDVPFKTVEDICKYIVEAK